jgi:hypothetical protein
MMLSTKFRFIWLVSSKTALQNESKLGRKHPWKVLYKDCLFSSDLLTNMVATDNSCFLVFMCPVKVFGFINLSRVL